MQVSEHFSFDEFVSDADTIPDGVLEKVKALCQDLLEPIRAHWNKPLQIDSGYRSQRHNAIVGGDPHSFHLYLADQAAADFVIPSIALSAVFDWIRLESHLPFDKVILERAKGRIDDQGACIHVQIQTHPRRLALIGNTHGQGAYQQVEVVYGITSPLRLFPLAPKVYIPSR